VGNLNPPTREVGDIYQLLDSDSASDLRVPFRLLSKFKSSLGNPCWTVETLHNTDRCPLKDSVLDEASSEHKPYFISDAPVDFLVNPARVAQQIWTAAGVDDSHPFTLVEFDPDRALWLVEVNKTKETRRVSDLVLSQVKHGSVMHFDEDWCLYRYPSRMAVAVDRARFPHACPRCKAPAYVGMLQVDCSRSGCRP
jgi:hypothetical protein